MASSQLLRATSTTVQGGRCRAFEEDGYLEVVSKRDIGTRENLLRKFLQKIQQKTVLIKFDSVDRVHDKRLRRYLASGCLIGLNAQAQTFSTLCVARYSADFPW
jgi:hypothetical protein